VDVEVVNGLAAVVAGVQDEAEAVGEFAVGERGGFPEQMTKDFCGGFGYVGEVLFWDEEPVGGGLRVDVGKGEGVFVFVDGFHGDFVTRDFAEETV
jgi:hypothetical protein